MVSGGSGFPAIGKADESKTYRELLDDPFLDSNDRIRLMADSTIAHAVTLLVQRNDRESAELILNVERFHTQYDDQGSSWDIWLEVANENLAPFTDEWLERFREICQEVSTRLHYEYFYIGLREILPDVGPSWRTQLNDQIRSSRRPTNQGRRVRLQPPRFAEDHLAFTNEGEHVVYSALRKIQENDLPREETIGIYPLAGGRIPGRTWEPDFLVTYRGRAGVLEIDGPHHNSRRALDVTRDHLLRDAGIAFVDRIPVEGLQDPAELNASLRRFLRRLRDTT